MSVRPQDQRVFAQAAQKFCLWILVRRTNPASLKYIGKPGYTPKPIDCKAKTADSDEGSCELAGLVTSPELHPRAFRPDKLTKAKGAWEEFARTCLGPQASRYALDTKPTSKHRGCITLQGKYVHADYDLYDLIDPEQARRNLAAVEQLLGQPHRRGPKFFQVQDFINRNIGADMVQHGGEAQYADHSQQALDTFGPNGEQVTILNEYSVRAWYENKFGGRPTLGH